MLTRTRPADTDGISDACNRGDHYDCPKCKRCQRHPETGQSSEPDVR